MLQNEFRSAKPAFDFIISNDFRKPAFACECTWEELMDTLNKPRNRDEVRRGMWGTALGASITMYADWTSDYDPGLGKKERHYGHGKGRADVLRMHRFLQRLRWWEMSPLPNVVVQQDDVCMGAEGKQYVVFLESGMSVDLKLTPGSYQGEWFNPREGKSPERIPVSRFDWPGGMWFGKTPSDTDWVLHISATN